MLLSAKKILLFVLATSLLHVSCKNSTAGSNKAAEQNNALKHTWYKRFTGTLDGQPVVVNLECYGKVTEGSYYYADKGIIINLLPTGDKEENNAVTLIEHNRGGDTDTAGAATWQLNIGGTTATGKWTGADGRQAIIDLKEGYPDGSYQMEIYTSENYKVERKGVINVKAATYYGLLRPAAQMNTKDADFLRGAILQILGPEKPGGQTLDDYVQAEDKKYFDDFSKLLDDMKIDREAHEDWEYNFENTRYLQVVYNNGGMLVLRLSTLNHTGGGIMGSHITTKYACIGLLQKRTWRLQDIMDIDAAKLGPLLDEEARKVFGISKGPIEGRLKVASIPLTDNAYITGKGVTFCYAPGVIAPEDDGEICLFLPYIKLKKLLKEDFNKRLPV